MYFQAEKNGVRKEMQTKEEKKLTEKELVRDGQAIGVVVGASLGKVPDSVPGGLLCYKRGLIGRSHV